MHNISSRYVYEAINIPRIMREHVELLRKWFIVRENIEWSAEDSRREVARNSCLEDDPWSCPIRGRLAKCNDPRWCNRRSVRNSITFMVKTRWCKRLVSLGHITLGDARPELEKLKGIFYVFFSRARVQCGLIDVVSLQGFRRRFTSLVFRTIADRFQNNDIG